ncbi:uncharacterized protein LOC119938721 [Tachyglossus aculeatus]|uniref:uncharacterized protein LOC119938721 n=1 Tax=Tachyglossus aculeatus TaxID=9261 RepID=UPI0018F2B8B8|nr:uncharacterized protein LOC119938721 [Tachyglossus aculeatus]
MALFYYLPSVPLPRGTGAEAAPHRLCESILSPAPSSPHQPSVNAQNPGIPVWSVELVPTYPWKDQGWCLTLKLVFSPQCLAPCGHLVNTITAAELRTGCTNPGQTLALFWEVRAGLSSGSHTVLLALGLPPQAQLFRQSRISSRKPCRGPAAEQILTTFPHFSHHHLPPPASWEAPGRFRNAASRSFPSTCLRSPIQGSSLRGSERYRHHCSALHAAEADGAALTEAGHPEAALRSVPSPSTTGGERRAMPPSTLPPHPPQGTAGPDLDPDAEESNLEIPP